MLYYSFHNNSQYRAAQLAQAETENQEQVRDNHEIPAMEDDVQDDDMEPQQVPIELRSHYVVPAKKGSLLKGWTYF